MRDFFTFQNIFYEIFLVKTVIKPFNSNIKWAWRLYFIFFSDFQRYFVTDHFIWHMKTYHTTRTKFHCFICQQHIDIERTKRHLSCHGIYDYQCLYCKFGTHNQDDIRLHATDHHADRPMLVRARKYRLDVDANMVSFYQISEIHIV